MYTLGIDIGASKVAVALVKNGRIVRRVRIAYRARSRREIEAAIFSAAGSAARDTPIGAIGIGVPCMLNAANAVLACPNIPALHPKAIAHALARMYGAPAKIANDVQAAALGELAYGIGRRIKNFIFIAFGTGIGGAIVIDEKLYRGERGWAGEFGHMRLPSDWERSASAQFLDTHKGGRALDALTAHIARGLLTVTYAFAPAHIVIGGGILPHWTRHFEKKVYREMRRRVIAKNLPLPRIQCSRLGENAGVLGAAALLVYPHGGIKKRKQTIL